jgi:hypothetical protein
MIKKEIFVLFLCLTIGFALRIYTLDHKSLWIDEIHTFNESRDGLSDQIEYYKENPTSLHPPLFFVLTHLFFPFQTPERDLRIIPLIFGTLSIPMIYLLSRSFSPSIGLPCALSLTFMVYHISLSQDGRSYSFLMFLGMLGLYFFVMHIKTLQKRYLFYVAILFSLLFYTSYNSIPFIVLSQIFWFYRARDDEKKPPLSSLLILNGISLILCLPWILFLVFHYRGQPLMDPYQAKVTISLWSIIYGILHDWVPYAPLLVISAILLILLLIFSEDQQNAIILLAASLLPIGGLYLFCKMFNITHFVTSRYFINFLPLFLISLYLSLYCLEFRLKKISGMMRLRVLFTVLFITSNLVILPLYFHSQKQDFRGLVAYLKTQLKERDKIFDAEMGYMPGILHYFGQYPEGRHYQIPFKKVSENEVEFMKSFLYRNRRFTIYSSRRCFDQYTADGSRLWIIVDKENAKKYRGDPSYIFKGYFDGSFLNFSKFPEDASMYLFLRDPLSPGEKGIDMPIE